MRTFIVMAICLSMVLFPEVSPSGSDEICHTWINTKYDSGTPPQKFMFHYDGTYATYASK
jgi:hypothetical protein